MIHQLARFVIKSAFSRTNDQAMASEAERSITQYREESQMDWEEQAGVVEMKF
jgi:hypothetical protein